MKTICDRFLYDCFLKKTIALKKNDSFLKKNVIDNYVNDLYRRVIVNDR